MSEFYKIRRGDTLEKISGRLGISIPDLIKLNNIKNEDRIYAGRSLKLPLLAEEAAQAPAAKQAFDVSARGNAEVPIPTPRPTSPELNVAAEPSNTSSIFGRTVTPQSDPKDIKLLQGSLQSMGYDLGKWGADGKYGRQTTKALQEFQRDNGLDITGHADQKTIASLYNKMMQSTHLNYMAGDTRPSERALEGIVNADRPALNIEQADMIEKAWHAIETGEPVVTPVALSSRPLIVLDLGHGAGEDEGAVSKHNKHSEVDVVDPVGRRMGEMLKGLGYDVVYTRNPGEAFRYGYSDSVGPEGLSSLEARAEFAHVYADMTGHEKVYFISLHADASSPSVRGATMLAGSLGNRNGRVDFGRAAIDPASKTLSHHLADHYQIGDKSKVTTADASMLEHFEKRDLSSDRVATLVELGYLSNKEDAAKLAEMAENPDKAAAALVKGLVSFDQSQQPPAPTPDVTRVASLEPTFH